MHIPFDAYLRKCTSHVGFLLISCLSLTLHLANSNGFLNNMYEEYSQLDDYNLFLEVNSLTILRSKYIKVELP